MCCRFRGCMDYVKSLRCRGWDYVVLGVARMERDVPKRGRIFEKCFKQNIGAHLKKILKGKNFDMRYDS